MNRYIVRVGLAVIVLLVASPMVRGSAYTWLNASGGNWSGGAGNWNFAGSPGPNDSATFNLSANYAVSFAFAPSAIQDLTVSGGAVTFNSSGTGNTLNVNSTTGGNQSVSISGASTSLTLGTSGAAGNSPMNLTAGNAVSLQNGGTLNAVFGSQVNTSYLFINSGTLLVDGNAPQPSTVSASGTKIQNALGSNGGSGTATFSNGAAGTFTMSGIDVANDSTAGTTGVLNVLSGATLNVGTLNLATNGGATTSATLNINGAKSTVTQTGTSALTVGHASTGTATIDIGTTTPGASLTTATGLFTINKTGTVNLGIDTNTGSTLNAHGDITINGGVLQNNGKANQFVWDAVHTMTITGGGRATFTNGFNTPSKAQYFVSGSGSKLETTNGQPAIAIQNLASVNVSSGGLLSSAGVLSLGSTSSDTATLIVDGTGSSAVSNANSASSWSGFKTNATFSNAATGTFNGGIDLAMSGDGASVGVNVQSGAALHIGNFNVAAGSFASSATVNITDAGSAVTLNSGGGPANPSADLVIGNASGGTATINVNNGGTLTVGAGGSTTLNLTGTLNIDGGTADLKTLNSNGGAINLVTGALSCIGNLTVGTGGLMGANLNLGTSQSVTLSGTTTVDPSHTLTLSGGTLNTGGLVVNGTFAFNSGTLGITQAGASINASIVSNSPSTTINISANNVTLGSAASFAGFIHQGTLNVGSNNVTLNSAGYAKLGVLTTLAGGTINAPNGVDFASGSNLLGHGTISARVVGELGSVLQADGALALGDATSPAGFNYAGELRTGGNSVTINASAAASLGNLTTLGSALSAGTLNATNGFVVDFGRVVSGYGTINSVNTLGSHAVINGTVQGNSLAQPITLSGWIKGVGTFNNVVFTGTYDPGFSPTLATVGSVGFGPSSTLHMELGGTSRGAQYDALIATGPANLGGSLDVSLINGFAPQVGDTFKLFDWNGGFPAGTFALQLPATQGALTYTWDASQLYTTGNLTLAHATYVLQSGLYNSTFTGSGVDVLKTTTAIATISGNNNYTGGTTVSAGTLVVANVNALGSGGLSINSAATTKLQAGLSGPVQLPGLTIAGGAMPTATLDVTDNNMVLHNGSISTTLAELKSGLNASGTLWAGAGINSSTAAADAAGRGNATVFAVGAIKNIDKNGNLIYSTWPASPSLDGGVSGLTTTDVLVKYTYFGDADLNGVVDNTTDYDLWSNGFTNPALAATNGWLYGDFDFSGVVDNTTDYDLWSTGFAHQSGPLAESVTPGFGGPRSLTAATVPVPEPATFLLALGAAAIAPCMAKRQDRSQ